LRPKEYYEQFAIQEDKRYIFALIPPEFEEQYKKYIKAPFEKIKLVDGKVNCRSHIEFDTGIDRLDEVWKNIQKASIIIANITGFKSSVMLELGVALMKKGERVILIAEKSLDGKLNLPFDVSTLGVIFYEPDKLDEFSNRLVNQVETLITPHDRIASPGVLYKPGPSAAGEDLSYKIDKRLPGKQHINEFKKEDESWENIVEMYAKVKDIDDEHGLVYLKCKYKKDSDETFERIFPLKHFKKQNKLKVDQSIIVQILERPGEVRFLFEEVGEDFFDRNVEDISINDLKDSPIFKPL
jgi:hypothetical protein